MVEPIHLMTIDTEFSSHPGDLGVTGRLGSEEFGAMRIADICRRAGVRATFFLDVYTDDPARARLLRDIGRRLQDAGHDLQLHTHPDGLYDRRRGCLAQYSLEEQTEILQEGTERFRRWFGVEPVAHRAGDWGANADTLRALRTAGLPIDSSLFFGWPTCALRDGESPSNRPRILEGLLEIPPTVFFNSGFGLLRRYRLLSSDGHPPREIDAVLQQLTHGRAAVTVSVFHSFSLLEWNAARTRYRVARHEVSKLERFVRAVGHDARTRGLTFSELYARYRLDPAAVLGGADGVPRSPAWFVVPRVMGRAQQALRGLTGLRPGDPGTSSRRTDSGMPIVYFGNDWSADNRTSSHHIAQRLSARYPLLYVESPGFRAPKANARDVRKLWKKLRNAASLPRRLDRQMWHMTLPQIPFRRLPFVRALNRRLGRGLVTRALRHLGFERPLLWFVTPHTAALAGQLDERGLVYYCIDDYASLPDIDRREIGRMDEALARQADQVFVSSPALLAPKQRLNPHTAYSPHGVDVELFQQALDPALPLADGVKNLRHPVVGFFGLLEAWVDRELLVYLARSRPEWTFLLIGRIAVDVRALRSLPNVVLPGAVPYKELPRWAKAFDAAIIPFRQSELVRSVNPLKLREYLATGKPVVSVWMPEVERFADCIGIARTHEEFLGKLEEALRTDSEAKRDARRKAVAGMTWEARVEEVLGIVQGRMEEKRQAALSNSGQRVAR